MIKDGQLIAIVGFMAVIDLVILIVWQIVDPMKPATIELSPRVRFIHTLSYHGGSNINISLNSYLQMYSRI